jgi:pSer/pThr/pTyr-binding forkhead associated (FHA) protein
MSSKHGVFINGNKINEETSLVDGDRITIGAITLWFTVDDFSDKESALSHYKKVGERSRPTYIE